MGRFDDLNSQFGVKKKKKFADLNAQFSTPSFPDPSLEDDEEEGGILSTLGKALNVSGDQKRRILPFAPGISIPEEAIPESLRGLTIGGATTENIGKGLTTGLMKEGGEMLSSAAETGEDILSFFGKPDLLKRTKDKMVGGLNTLDEVRQGLPFPLGSAQPEHLGDFGPTLGAAADTGKMMAKGIGGMMQEPGQSFEEAPITTGGMAMMATGFDPVGFGLGKAMQGAKFLGNKYSAGKAARAGNRTGAGERVFEIGEEIGRSEGFRGGERTKILKEAQSGERSMLGTVQNFRDAASEVRTFMGDRIKGQIAEIQKKFPNRRMDLQGIKDNIQKTIVQSKIQISRDPSTGKVKLTAGPNSDFLGMQNELGPLENLANLADEWTDASIDGVWRLRRNVDDLRKQTGDFSDKGKLDRVINASRDKIRDSLHELEGFAKLDDDWTAGSDFLDTMETHLGIKRSPGRGGKGGRIDETELPPIDQNMQTKIGNMLNDRSSSNLEMRRAVMKEMDKILEKKTGTTASLESELAGQMTGKEAAKGIAGRMQASNDKGDILAMMGGGGLSTFLGGDVMSGGAAALLGKKVWTTLRMMTTENPKSAMTFFRALGATERKIDQISEVVEGVYKSLPANVAKVGVPFGVLYDRLNGGEDVLSQMGSTQFPMNQRRN